jgi:putative transposase
VVFNDALLARQEAYAAGDKISDTQVQARVVTLARTTPQRGWPGEVAPVALVQACQDARRGCRSWYDCLSGKRKGRKVGHPRFRSRKDHRASIRLTRNGFARHHRRGAGGEGRGRSFGVVPRPAVGAMQCDGGQGGGRSLWV